MRVTVEAFAGLKEALGFSSREFEVEEGASASSVTVRLASEFTGARNLLAISSVAVNGEYASKDVALADGDTLSLLPPVSGGGGRVEITEQPLDAAAASAAVADPGAGAIVLFSGVVRNVNEGCHVSGIDYECKPDMAAREIERILDEANGKFRIIKSYAASRMGKLKVGETSTLIAVSAAHRQDAYAANAWILDELKKRAPIWKRESRLQAGVEEKKWL